MYSLQTFLASTLALCSTARFGVNAQASYDFVIVGGGAAGLALATRLSEVDSQSVLVLEAGPHPEVVKAYMTPGANQQVLGTELDWGFVTAPQESLGNRTITYNRGRGLGGSTLINGLTYGRGSSSIYDLWSNLGNNGFDWKSVLPYFVKSTSFAPNHVAPFQTFDASTYSTNGPITLSYPHYVYNASTAFIEALDVLNTPVAKELNLGDNIGAKQEPLVLSRKQQRVSSYDGYYKPVRNRPNLTVKSMAMVQQVILEQRSTSPTATGVVYSDMSSGMTLNVTANKEVVLSLGVFQTPQLLMLSGMWPQETLASFGIEPYLVNENIGRNMQDHFYFSVIARSLPDASASDLYNNVARLQAAQAQYASNASGPLTTPIGATYGFRRLSEEELQSNGATYILANRTNQAHIEYLWENIYFPSAPSTTLPQYPPNRNESFFSITSALLAPSSRGNVTLRSNTIQDAPVINVNYLETVEDQKMALFMLRSLRTLLAREELSRYTVGPDHGEVAPGADITDDDTLLEYIKSTLLTVWHACGTCRMMPKSAGGVVDARLRVHGVSGLRIVDTSIFPVVPDQHTQGPAYMVAEKAADMIKEDYGLAA